MRTIAEAVGIIAGSLAIATYLGLNIKRFFTHAKEPSDTNREEPPWGG